MDIDILERDTDDVFRHFLASGMCYTNGFNFQQILGYRSRKAAYRKLLRVHFLQKHKKNAGQRLQTEMGRLELDTEAY